MLLSLGIDASDWREVGLVLAGGLGLALGLTLWLVLRGAPRSRDPLVAAYLQCCARLARRGLPRFAHEPVLAYARRAAARLPDSGQSLLSLSSAYAAQRYEPAPDAAARIDLIRKLRRFRSGRVLPDAAPSA
jgi:hypothetical protein